MIKLTIDDQTIEVEEGTKVLEAAQQLRIKIPTLCYHKALPSYGACRLCLVEVSQNGGPVSIQASCNYPAQEGLVVKTDTERVIKARRIMAELLLARCPDSEEVKKIAKELGVERTRIKPKHKDCLLCGLCVRMCHNRMGRGAIGFAYRGSKREVQPAFDKQSDICQTCGACFSICPTEAIKFEKITKNEPRPLLSEFDGGLRERSAIYIPFPQAVPNYAIIDEAHCVSLQTGECKICQEFCEAGAINYDQKEETLKLNVGSIILSHGFQPYDPSINDTYQYNHFPNVVTSLEFERILSASGPFEGHLVRPSDHKEPKKIAWIQCVGSRNTQVGDKGYCSAVCCTYAIKQAMIAKEHSHEPLDTAIFYIDVRTYGKEFERYYNRAKDEVGIRFVKSKINNVFPGEKEGDLKIRYTDESGRMIQEDFDIVVLSIGLNISQESVDFAGKIGVDLNHYNFVNTSSFEPVTTSRPGVYTCGVFEAPKDIPDTVAQASAAAASATSTLAEVRGTRVKTKEYPPERDVSKEPIRIGVFICHCGINIGGIAHVPEIVEYAKTLPHVEYAEANLFTCSEDTQVKMKEVIQEKLLNRVVVASCTPRTHQVLFRETCREAGLNPYLFEMANIRDQCTWVHMQEPEKATDKAKDLVRMSVARAATLEQLYETPQTICQEALVIGGGVAGMTAALGLSEQGFKAHLIERENRLGGQALRLRTTWKDERVQPYIEEMVKKVNENSLIDVHMQTNIKEVHGTIGNFTCKVADAQGKETNINYGAAIIANGADSYEPEEYLYGEDPNILLSLDLDQEIMQNTGRLRAVNTAVFIQCVGSREPNRPYCSKVCCTHSIHSALTLKELNPDMGIYILYRDIRTYGEREDLYREARLKGIRFIRYDIEDKPTVEKKDGRLRVTVKDQVIKRSVEIDTDIITLASAVVPRDDNSVFSGLFKVAMTQDGFFMEAHAKLRPVDFASGGMFVCGLAHGPKAIDEAISQAKATVSRACTIISKKEMMVGGAVAEVDPDLCAICLTCIRVCPFGVPQIDYENSVAKIDPGACQGCGICASMCPNDAIQVSHYKDSQMIPKLMAVY
jgi:heterodisulfide reductase subunit A